MYSDLRRHQSQKATAHPQGLSIDKRNPAYPQVEKGHALTQQAQTSSRPSLLRKVTGRASLLNPLRFDPPL